MTSRPYDLVLFGATGFTGKLVAEYLVAHAPAGVRWALAGRSLPKLEAVRRDLSRVSPSAANLPILLGDSDDAHSMETLAKQSRVVCTTVGPYMKYGRALVSACADSGTHYCDLTGEVPFMRDTIDRCHARAKETGARIVHTCGFDSIPSDLGVRMIHEHAKSLGKKLAWVRFYAGESKGGVSGGTIASMLELIQLAKKDPKIRRVMGNPYALDPDPTRGPDGGDQLGVRFDDDMQMWTGPFVMAAVNTRVVRRSNALLGHAYGPSFRYSEQMTFGKGPKGFLMASALSAGLVGFMGAASLSPTRKLLERTVLPAPGEGPSKEARDNGFFVIRFLAETEADGGAPIRISARVEGKSDPGYGETAKMLSQSALCLALDEDVLPAGGGVLTPATSMGMILVDRLRAAAMVFEVQTV
ncbi:MAG: saccharopine dehydrogenase NADP-binding domain-containing protein [Polyangiaceae bacterium]